MHKFLGVISNISYVMSIIFNIVTKIVGERVTASAVMAVIQTYVFTMLIGMYLSDAMHLGH